VICEISADSRIQEVLSRYTEGPTTGIFTDGGAQPNPGPGGWGYVWVRDNEIVSHDCGFEPETTNNRMELSALIAAFRATPSNETVTVYSDSELCVKTVNEWAPMWKARGWKRSSGPIKNLELVQELFDLHLNRPNISLRWIKAHNGWRWNEYADALSTAWTRNQGR
jgi:ribonuclease HI